jgi:hypothetical protein
MNYFCCEEGRRSLVRAHATLNGIDYLEVVDAELKGTLEEAARQRRLRVFFVQTPGLALLARFGADSIANAALLTISGGTRTTAVTVRSAAWSGDHLEVEVNPRGDYSRYSLSLVEPGTDDPLKELDPVLARVDFSFKVECESDFDCRPICACPPTTSDSPELDYLARDYASFRQLMVDRLAALAPDWREGNPADVGVTLVELLAYVGDYLSYRQDAVATEGYLGTARSRVSVRRHARLLDYAMHDGANARAWVQVRVKAAAANGVVLPLAYVVSPQNAFLRAESSALAVPPGDSERLRRPRFITRLDANPLLAEHEFQKLARESSVEVFEPVESARLFPEHNEMFFHTWGNDVCCLPKGATKAVLRGNFPNLSAGAVLVFVERLGPKTGSEADANPSRRHAVRLTRVSAAEDPLSTPPLPVTKIEWADADALPFPFCVSARAESGGQQLADVSVALGNIVLADHGRTLLAAEPLPAVPSPQSALAPVSADGCGHCEPPERLTAPSRFRPLLKEQPLAQAAPHDPARPAVEAFEIEVCEVLPAIRLSDDLGRLWQPQRDLLSSDAFAPEFVVEVENDGRTSLRFGDDENGLAPGEGTNFKALYRVGNGARGNVGAEALVQLVADYVLVRGAGGQLLPESPAGLIESISNPMPAHGGVDPEPLEEARQNAPAAFRVQQRAVTPSDYTEKAGEHPDVQRAAATLRWTGSWPTVFLTVDRRGGRAVDDEFENDLRRFLERYRMAGQDLEIDGPRYVPLELELRVCVAANYFRSDVVAALHRVFDSRAHADGTRGFFHPDNFTFGQPVLLSRIYAEAQRVAGVRHVEVTLLRRQGATTGEDVPASDRFEVGGLEIVQLENDPNFPDRGVLRFNPVGGR